MALNNELGIKLYPKPTEDQLFLSMESTSVEELYVEILDQSGRVQKLRQFELFEGLNTYQMEVAMLPAGQYYVRARAGSGTSVLKFIKK